MIAAVASKMVISFDILLSPDFAQSALGHHIILPAPIAVKLTHSHSFDKPQSGHVCTYLGAGREICSVDKTRTLVLEEYGNSEIANSSLENPGQDVADAQQQLG